jgi:hypothetical protein
VARQGAAGQSSTASGYSSGGYTGQYVVTIDKFPFATDTDATDVGDLTVARQLGAGQSSTENGYTSGGGNDPGTGAAVIDKFPFASNSSATDVGDLYNPTSFGAGQSSIVSGYTTGKGTTQSSGINASKIIQKFSFASDGDSSDVGNLSWEVQGAAGQQY